ncbi:hypothetical protein niasHS_003029 [Heterodera schachtii]|uniref:Uncharacterized protein n=1 Tax=Heterodera schachtii TaxID=97005 RepID=A0ABD2K9Z1_HETSC
MFPNVPNEAKKLELEGDFIRIDGKVYPAKDFLESFNENGKDRPEIKWDESGDFSSENLDIIDSYISNHDTDDEHDHQTENRKTPSDEKKLNCDGKCIEIDGKLYKCEDTSDRPECSKNAQHRGIFNEISAVNNEEEAEEVHSKRSETSMIVRQVFPKIPEKAKKLWYENETIRIDGTLYPSEAFLESTSTNSRPGMRISSQKLKEIAIDEKGTKNIGNKCRKIANKILHCVQTGARFLGRACTFPLKSISRCCRHKCLSCKDVSCREDCECNQLHAADKQD